MAAILIGPGPKPAAEPSPGAAAVRFLGANDPRRRSGLAMGP